MKNLKTTELNKALVILAWIAGYCFALPVDVETAKNVGQAFRTNNNPAAIKSLRSASDLTLAYTAGNISSTRAASAQKPLFYVFNADGGGFVIVSGDDAVEPILAYSNKNSFDAQEINPALRYWLDGYEKQMEYVRENELLASDETAEKWANLMSGKNIRASGNGKGPLVSAKWSQWPYYNDSCPPETPVGCVAVAMGQIMNYWKFPFKGNGSHSYMSDYGELRVNFSNAVYDWAFIPDSLNSSNSTAEKNELAKLLYHLGVSVEMKYAPDASGAYVYFRTGYRYDSKHSSQTALNTFFGYDDSMIGIERSKLADNEWLSVIKKEIDEGRPVIYSGYDKARNSGHAFVCDGYDYYDRLHINWGWGGSGDGYFLANNLALSLYNNSYNYNSDQDILIGIAPPQKFQPFDIRLDEISMADAAVSYGDEILINAKISNRGSNIFRGNFCAIFSNDEGEIIDFATIYDDSVSANDYVNFDFSSNTSPYFQFGEYNVEIYYAVSGGNWLKFDDLPQNEQIRITVKENYGTPVRAAKSAAIKTGFAGIRNGQINLYLKAGTYAAELYTLQGRLIKSVNISATNGRNATGLKVDNLSNGIFVLNVKQAGVSVLRHKITVK